MIDLNKVAIIAGEHNVTYSELLKRVAQFARKTPKGKQTKTVIFSENREGWAYAFFSIWLNEGIAVPVDASSTASDVAYILNDCRPDAIWVSKEKEPVLEESLAAFNGEEKPKVFIIDDYEGLSLQDEPACSILPWAALSEPDNDDTSSFFCLCITSCRSWAPSSLLYTWEVALPSVLLSLDQTSWIRFSEGK